MPLAIRLWLLGSGLSHGNGLYAVRWPAGEERGPERQPRSSASCRPGAPPSPPPHGRPGRRPRRGQARSVTQGSSRGDSGSGAGAAGPSFLQPELPAPSSCLLLPVLPQPAARMAACASPRLFPRGVSSSPGRPGRTRGARSAHRKGAPFLGLVPLLLVSHWLFFFFFLACYLTPEELQRHPPWGEERRAGGSAGVGGGGRRVGPPTPGLRARGRRQAKGRRRSGRWAATGGRCASRQRAVEASAPAAGLGT